MAFVQALALETAQVLENDHMLKSLSYEDKSGWLDIIEKRSHLVAAEPEER